jgi:hypothetical protein
MKTTNGIAVRVACPHTCDYCRLSMNTGLWTCHHKYKGSKTTQQNKLDDYITKFNPSCLLIFWDQKDQMNWQPLSSVSLCLPRAV